MNFSGRSDEVDRTFLDEIVSVEIEIFLKMSGGNFHGLFENLWLGRENREEKFYICLKVVLLSQVLADVVLASICHIHMKARTISFQFYHHVSVVSMVCLDTFL